MSSDELAISARQVSKAYTIAHNTERPTTMGEALMHRIKKPVQRAQKETFWALKDVSFEVNQGEIVGIIGYNGAGKSTLLKILSEITEPTAGKIDVYGRIGSLLEVGTGFHPELTGRENIYLNGAILGMRRREINQQFDAIVEFAEVEQFLDTPVKRYSSGMYVRLAFAVAAHLNPEILVVDEVLAVGDANFQKKCLGKMGDVARSGRTVLFVSHNMNAVNQLCSRAILLAEGKIVRDGAVADIVSQYLQGGSEGSEQVWDKPLHAPGNNKIRLHAVRVITEGKVASDVSIEKEVTFEVEFWNFVPNIRNLCVNIYLLDSMGGTVLSTANTPAANSTPEEWFDQPHSVGLFRSTCTLPGNFLNEGLYYISVYIITLGPIVIHVDAPQLISFTVFDTGVMREPGAGSHWDGVVRVRLPWGTELVEPLNRDNNLLVENNH